MSSTVSVALGTHNGAAYLEQQLRSILSQTVTPVEIVLSDDASTDTTVDLAERVVAGSGVRLRVIRNETPLGVTRNFEQAILACGSEFVALCDQDDEWMPDRLEQALRVFQARPQISLVHGNATLIDAVGAPLGASLFEALGIGSAAIADIHEGRAFDLLMKRNLVTGAATMLRRSLAESSAPFPPGWVHDEWLAIVAAAHDAIDVIDEPILGYRQHGANQIGVKALSFAGKLGRMLEPGAERNDRLLERAKQLEKRLASMDGVPSERREAAVEKRRHEEARSGLHGGRLRRIGPVLRELRTGRYRLFGRGAADGVRDLLQPLKGSG